MWTIQYETNQMVSRHAGTLPVLLTSPHGAPVTAKPPGVSQRTGSSPGCPPDKLVGDSFTRQIATAVAQLLLETVGEAPYVVIAEYHRKFIDANRSEQCAFNVSEAAAARPFYAEYRQTIRTFMDEIQAENGPRGFLFDIHGTKTIEEDPADVYIGTDNGKSAQRLFTADPLAVFGRRSLRVSYKPPATSFHRPDRAFPRRRRWTVDSRRRPTVASTPTGWTRCDLRSLSRSARVCPAGKLSSNILGELSRALAHGCFKSPAFPASLRERSHRTGRHRSSWSRHVRSKEGKPFSQDRKGDPF